MNKCKKCNIDIQDGDICSSCTSKQTKNLKIVVLVQGFLIVILASSMIINKDDSTPIQPTITPSINQEQTTLPEIKPEIQPEIDEESSLVQGDLNSQEDEKPNQENNVEVESDIKIPINSLIELADQDGYVIESGVLVKYFGDETTLIIPETVTTIGKEAFSECEGLTNVTIPKTVTRIEDSAFKDLNTLTYLTYSDSIEYVGNDVFTHTKWYDNLNQEYNIIGDGVLIKYIEKDSKDISLPNTIKSISGKAFYNATSIQSLKIPTSVTSIGDNAFASCWSLEEIEIPPIIGHIGENVFNDTPWFYNLSSEFSIVGQGFLIKYNANFPNISLPATVRVISSGVFEDMNFIESLVIPNSVTYIGDRAFANCINLKTLKIPVTVSHIGESVFENTLWYEQLNEEFNIIGDNILIKYTGNNANVTIPDEVKSIYERAFVNASSMITLTIPDSVEQIDLDAFNYNYFLKDLNLNNQLIKQSIVENYEIASNLILKRAVVKAQEDYIEKEYENEMQYYIYVDINSNDELDINVQSNDITGDWIPSLKDGYNLVITDNGEILSAELL